VQAGSLLYDPVAGSAGNLLTPWQGFSVLCAWTVLLLAGATIVLRRRDA
jgi:hypothetical protein